MASVSFRGMLLAGVIFALLLGGCGSEPVAPPSHNRHFVTPEGHFVGHLKPELYEGPPTGIDGKPIAADDPVVWIVEGDAVSQPEYEFDVSTYRLDFDESQPLTEDVLPFALMTNETRQVVIHCGPPALPFTHSEINDGEAAHGIGQCVNRECSRVKEIDNAALFPLPKDEASPKCPFCGDENIQPYVTPQHRNMRDFMQRHP